MIRILTKNHCNFLLFIIRLLLDENADAIGRMASAIAHIFLSDKTTPSVNVSINLQEIPNGPQISMEPKTS